ncbi:MAG: transglutaminase-like domain-containing protein [Rhodospirillaceae bacterium]
MTIDPRQRLHDLGPAADEAVPYMETALALSAARASGQDATAPIDTSAPRAAGRDMSAYHRHVDRLTQEVSDYAGSSASGPWQRSEALVQVVCRRYGYGGNDQVFDDLGAADLAHVIDTRRGLAVALGIIYLEICHRLGWPLVGIDFPGHFVLRMDAGGERIIVDPFAELRVLEAQDLRAILKNLPGGDMGLEPRFLTEMTPRRVLLRLENNIRIRQMRRSDLAGAAETLGLMVAFAPGAADLWRELGMVNARLDRVQDAVLALEKHIRLAPESAARYHASRMLQELQAKLN